MSEDQQEQLWKHRFVAKFIGLLKSGGYMDTDDGVLDVAYQHANASWPERDGDDTPEDAAVAEYEALADSV